MGENKTDSTLRLMPIDLDETFTVQFRGDHVHVRLGRNYTLDPETQNEFWREVRAACDEHESRRVLVEGYVPSGERGTAEVVDAGQRAAVIPNLWLAFHLKDYVPNERSELFQVIAAASGVRVKFFSDHERALLWLRSNAPQ